jgi:beta-mannosidase
MVPAPPASVPAPGPDHPGGTTSSASVPSGEDAVTRMDLSGLWALTVTDGPIPFPVADVPASVPGSFLADLLDAGMIQDPYIDAREQDVAWSGECDLSYRRTFTVGAALLAQDRVDLVAASLDTAATILINDHEIARTQNQYRSWRFDVKAALQEGENTLEVLFDAPLRVARQNQKVLGDLPYVGNALPYNAIRKMCCNMGWDWGPVLVTSGIAGPIGLEAWSGARLDELHPQVTVTLPAPADDARAGHPHDPGAPTTGGSDASDGPVGTVRVLAEIEYADGEPSDPSAQAPTYRLQVLDPAGTPVAGTTDVVGPEPTVLSVDVADPDLWWPRGYGEQVLYTVRVDLLDAHGTVLDHRTHRVGFRNAGFVETPDEIGTSFTMTVNDRPVLVKGANWIPDDALYTRQTRDTYRRGVADAVDAGMNMLRVWGGGLYESEDFYRACDEQGILVWQDFATACAAYSEREPLFSEFEAEAREQIVRLAWHPSLSHWNGSNENVEGYWYWGWKDQIPEGVGWGNTYYTELFPSLLAELDPTRSYSPSSPYSRPVPEDPHDVRYGTIHNWRVWGDSADNDYVHYRDSVPRFSAEFGFQGPPSRATADRMITERPLVPDSPAMLNHQKAIGGQDLLTLGYQPYFPEPSGYDDFWLTTALNQARALQVGIGHYRAHWPTSGGTIVWQLNDCWPVTSWAAVDGDQRRKLLWYALRDMYEPILVTLQPGTPDKDGEGGLQAVIGNDTDQELTVDLHLRRLRFDGTLLSEQIRTVTAPARGTLAVPSPPGLEVPDDPADEVVLAELTEPRTDAAATEGSPLTHTVGCSGASVPVRDSWFFAPDKELTLDPDALDVQARPADDDGVDLHLTARALVRDVCVIADDVHPDAAADRQLVTLLPGETTTVHVTLTDREATGSATGSAAPDDVPTTLDPQAFLAPGIVRHVGELVAG